MCASPGFSASWPETKTKSPARIACEYGAPWNGAGAASVRTTVLSATFHSFRRARVGERDAECLEDRLEHVLAVGSVQQADVQRQPCSFREAFEEAARPLSPQRLRESAAERRARFGDLCLRRPRLDLEDEVEGGVLRHPLQQRVEHGQARLDARRAAAAELDPDPAPPGGVHVARRL